MPAARHGRRRTRLGCGDESCQGELLHRLQLTDFLPSLPGPYRRAEQRFSLSFIVMFSMMRNRYYSMRLSYLTWCHPSDWVSESVSDALAYSSLFWFAHLKQSKLGGDVVQDVVSELLCTIKLLFWLELSSLQGTMLRTAEILDECTVFFKVSEALCFYNTELTPHSGVSTDR